MASVHVTISKTAAAYVRRRMKVNRRSGSAEASIIIEMACKRQELPLSTVAPLGKLPPKRALPDPL